MVRRKYRKLFLIILILKLATLIILFFYFPKLLYLGKVTINQFSFDESPPPTDKQLIQELIYKYPNIPFEFSEYTQNLNRSTNYSVCAPYPDIWQLDLENVYWQKFSNRNMSMKLFNAYYDCREIEVTPVVRILGMSKTTRDFPTTYCQIWFYNKNESVIVPVSFRVLWSWSLDMDVLYSYMLTCSLPDGLNGAVPQTVSLVGNECDKARNNMKVIYNPLKPNETQQEFAICMKFLNFPHVDRSPHLVEWFELMKLLGVTKIGTYKYMNHENIEKVLQYYKNSGFLDYTPITMATGYSAEGGLAYIHYKYILEDQMMNELIPFNDCFYKNMYKFKYIALVDSDEVIMPQQQLKTWHDLVQKLDSEKENNCTAYASYCFRNAYFPPYEDEERYSENIPTYLHMLQHVKRVENLLDEYSATKCIHNTKYVWALHNHWPFEQKDSCEPKIADPSIGILNHYRQPDNGVTINDTTITDTSVWRYKDDLLENCKKNLRLIFENEHFFIKYQVIHIIFILLIISVILASCS